MVPTGRPRVLRENLAKGPFRHRTLSSFAGGRAKGGETLRGLFGRCGEAAEFGGYSADDHVATEHYFSAKAGGETFGDVERHEPRPTSAHGKLMHEVRVVLGGRHCAEPSPRNRGLRWHRAPLLIRQTRHDLFQFLKLRRRLFMRGNSEPVVNGFNLGTKD